MHIKSWQAVLIPVVISFVLVALEIPSNTWFTTAGFSLAAGVAALSLMAVAAILAARWSFVESWFGGLDRIYQAHKWMGIWALGLASFHLVFKADLDEWQVASILSLPSGLTRLVRQLSYVVVVFIVLLALNRKIPYKTWRWWHKLSGPLFLIVILHWLSFRSPIELASPSGIWLAVVAIVGVVAAAYKLFLYPFLSDHAEYEVVGVLPGEQAVQLQLVPTKGKTVRFESGQFGFLRLKEEGLREPHPFTIASGKAADGQVDFLIRGLGDYTQKLIAEARIGMHADIYAPYGRFQRHHEDKREVWIGGGVGISPFIAWLKDEDAANFERVTLFYFYTPGREFPSTEELEEMTRKRGAELVCVPEGPASLSFRHRFAEIAKEDGPSAVSVNFCGPKGLLKAVRKQMRTNGVPESSLRYEYFEFR